MALEQRSKLIIRNFPCKLWQSYGVVSVNPLGTYKSLWNFASAAQAEHALETLQSEIYNGVRLEANTLANLKRIAGTKTHANKILLKNLPCNWSEFEQKHKNILELFDRLEYGGPVVMKSFGRRRALLTFSCTEQAEFAMNELENAALITNHQIKLQLFQNKPQKENELGGERKRRRQHNKAIQVDSGNDDNTVGGHQTPLINKYIQKLYACNDQLNFDQPPPPYLKYAYPKITPDILDAISIALLSNTRFYTQVLHLMNRMNLEPPFVPKPKANNAEAFLCQKEQVGLALTNDDQNKTKCVRDNNNSRSSSSNTTESELETSDDEKCAQVKPVLVSKRKFDATINEQFRKKARLLLQQQKQRLLLNTTATNETNDDDTTIAAGNVQNLTKKIALKIPTELTTDVEFKATKTVEPVLLETIPKITDEQLKQLPIYKNYTIGTPSNKLYLKNLPKNINETDLLGLYANFTAVENLRVKVMQQGRMKGQAFVEFHNLSPATSAAPIIADALSRTNGLLLRDRDKPIVVCYGRN